MKKLLTSTLIASSLFLGLTSQTQEIDVMTQKQAVKYAPIIKQTFKAINSHTMVNMKDKSDVIEIELKGIKLKKGCKYVVSFKNDNQIKIKEVKQ
ncbi:hypothetical protein [Staphylococcus phage PT94]